MILFLALSKKMFKNHFKDFAFEVLTRRFLMIYADGRKGMCFICVYLRNLRETYYASLGTAAFYLMVQNGLRKIYEFTSYLK